MPMIPDWTRAGIAFHFSPSATTTTATLPDGRTLPISLDRYRDSYEVIGSDQIFYDGFKSEEDAEGWIVDNFGDGSEEESL